METKVTRYQSYSGTIAAGDTFPINRQGRSVTCLSASDDLEIVIDDGSRSFFTAGISMEFDDPFSKIQLHNPTGGPVTFLIATAMGKVDDNRLTASGNIKVLDPGAGGESFADVIAAIGAITNTDVVAMLQNADDQRAPVYEVGASFLFSTSIASGAGGTTIVSPGSNTSGVILRTLNADGNGNVVTLFVDTAGPSAWNDTSKRAVDFIRNEAAIALPLEIPAGQGLYASASGAGSRLVATWDNL